MDSLLLAQGRISRHPTHIKVVDDTVVEEVLNTIEEEDIANRPQVPFYFTSSKKFVTETQQHTVKLTYPIFEDVILTKDENVGLSSFPWVMDTSWENIVSEELGLIETLKNELLQGKPVRLRITEQESFLLTDVLVASVTRNNFLAALIPALYPSEPDDIMKSDYLVISFSLLESLNNTQLDCWSSSLKGSNIGPAYVNQTSGAWFITTKTWSKLYVIDSTKRVTYGGLQKLKESIEMGKNIRVCVRENSDHFYCLAGAYVAIKHETWEAILESNPFVDPLAVFEPDPKVKWPLMQKILLISSAGWVERAWVNIGNPDTRPQRQNFEDMSWFSEED